MKQFAMYAAQGYSTGGGALREGVGDQGKTIGPDHPDVAKNVIDYAGALRKIGRTH